MSTLTATQKEQVISQMTLSQDEAAKFSGLSYKTLLAYTAKGEATGQIRIGRRVMYLRPQLERWLQSKVVAPKDDARHVG